jgi:hypothetical protein
MVARSTSRSAEQLVDELAVANYQDASPSSAWTSRVIANARPALLGSGRFAKGQHGGLESLEPGGNLLCRGGTNPFFSLPTAINLEPS